MVWITDFFLFYFTVVSTLRFYAIGHPHTSINLPPLSCIWSASEAVVATPLEHIVDPWTSPLVSKLIKVMSSVKKSGFHVNSSR